MGHFEDDLQVAYSTDLAQLMEQAYVVSYPNDWVLTNNVLENSLYLQNVVQDKNTQDMHTY